MKSTGREDHYPGCKPPMMQAGNMQAKWQRWPICRRLRDEAGILAEVTGRFDDRAPASRDAQERTVADAATGHLPSDQVAGVLNNPCFLT